jgi:PhnB protein
MPGRLEKKNIEKKLKSMSWARLAVRRIHDRTIKQSTITTKIMINSIVQPYLFFDGKCEEAIEFYQKAIGATVNMLMRFKDSPEPTPPGCGPADSNKVMHAQFRIGETVIMASDGRASGQPKFEGFALSLSVKTEAEADNAFNALAAGGKVEMPLAKTFFSAKFGMVADKFGVFWMVLVTPNSAK